MSMIISLQPKQEIWYDLPLLRYKKILPATAKYQETIYNILWCAKRHLDEVKQIAISLPKLLSKIESREISELYCNIEEIVLTEQVFVYQLQGHFTDFLFDNVSEILQQYLDKAGLLYKQHLERIEPALKSLDRKITKRNRKWVTQNLDPCIFRLAASLTHIDRVFDLMNQVQNTIPILDIKANSLTSIYKQ